MSDWGRLCEARITRIEFPSATREFVIGLRSADAQTDFVMRAGDVHDLLVREMRWYNLVDEFVMHSDFESLELRELVQWLVTGEEQPYVVGARPEVERWIDKLAAGGWQVCAVSAVCGASMVIVAKSFSLEAVSVAPSVDS